MLPAISIRELSKRYRIRRASNGRYGTDLADDAAQFLKSLIRGKLPRREYDDFWALRNVSLDIMPGDVVGLMGRNGAGKSTLLKTLARVVRPTEGEAIIRGRVGSLLEVGTGFHPDLTGRENVYLAGAIMGLSRSETRSKFNDIVEFSEITAFLDTPVKRYSSGMYTRLAFSVAAHLDSDVLLVDEVLAVGDAEFQRKCLGRMNAVAREGRTVVYVSHNLASIKALCNRAILFKAGELIQDGAVADVAATYLQNTSRSEAEIEWTSDTAPRGESIRLLKVWVEDETGVRATEIDTRKAFHMGGIVQTDARFDGMRVLFKMVDSEGHVVCTSNDFLTGSYGTTDPGLYKFRIDFPPCLFNVNQVSVSFSFDAADPIRHSLLETDQLLALNFIDPAGHGVFREILPGVILPPASWTVTKE